MKDRADSLAVPWAAWACGCLQEARAQMLGCSWTSSSKEEENLIFIELSILRMRMPSAFLFTDRLNV